MLLYTFYMVRGKIVGNDSKRGFSMFYVIRSWTDGWPERGWTSVKPGLSSPVDLHALWPFQGGTPLISSLFVYHRPLFCLWRSLFYSGLVSMYIGYIFLSLFIVVSSYMPLLTFLSWRLIGSKLGFLFLLYGDHMTLGMEWYYLLVEGSIPTCLTIWMLGCVSWLAFLSYF